MKNFEIARILHKIAIILEMKDMPFKPQAYHRAARGIELLNEDIEDVCKRGDLEKIEGVGKSIAEKITEYIKTGKIKHYEKLQKQYKINLDELDSVPTLGPKKIKVLYEKLKVRNLKDLEKVAKAGKIQELKGFTEKTEQNILKGVEIAKSKPKRYLYAEIKPVAEKIVKYFQGKPFVKRIEVAGSYRRKKATIGDLDLLVVSTQPKKVMEAFVAYPGTKDILASGATKGSIRLKSNLQIDLRVVKEKEFGAALQYFTGDKAHNIKLRKIAQSKGYLLNEYGLFTLKDKKWIAGRTEEEIYKKLGLKCPAPDKRNS